MPRRGTKSKVTISAVVKLDVHTAEALFHVNEALFEATQEVIGFDALETARALCPILTQATSERVPGELRDSIDARVRRDKKGVRARMSTNSGYGYYVETGTVKMSAEPFLYPAFMQEAPRLEQAIKERLADLVTDKKSNG